METVEVVIKIPKKCKEFLDNGGKVDWLDAIPIIDAIANGTVLPKGHGRLYDLDAALKCMEEVADDKSSIKECAMGFFDWACSKRVVLEADKEKVKPNMQESQKRVQPPCRDYDCHNYEIGEGGCAICTYDAERIIEGEPCHKYKTRGRD